MILVQTIGVFAALMSVIGVVLAASKAKRPLLRALGSAVCGAASLGAVNLLAGYTGVSIALNYATAFVAVVLGAPGVLPKSQPWDQSVLERRLEGANVVILPFNNVGVGVLGAPGLLIRLAQVKGGPIEDRLPAGLKLLWSWGAVRRIIGQASADLPAAP